MSMQDYGSDASLSPMPGQEMPFAFSTTEQEIMAYGWTRDQMPTGATPPPRMMTAGSRGESQLDNDVDPTQFQRSSYHEEDGAP